MHSWLHGSASSHCAKNSQFSDSVTLNHGCSQGCNDTICDQIGRQIWCFQSNIPKASETHKRHFRGRAASSPLSLHRQSFRHIQFQTIFDIHHQRLQFPALPDICAVAEHEQGELWYVHSHSTDSPMNQSFYFYRSYFVLNRFTNVHSPNHSRIDPLQNRSQSIIRRGGTMHSLYSWISVPFHLSKSLHSEKHSMFYCKTTWTLQQQPVPSPRIGCSQIESS